MDLSPNSWSPLERNLIYLIRKRPITYLTPPTKKHPECEAAWKEIGTLLCQKDLICKRLWTKIKYKYAKITILINTGLITKQAAKSHPKTSKFFDGLLTFMDPCIGTITDEKIPFLIHKSINRIFGLLTTTTLVHAHAAHPSLNRGSYTQFVSHTQVKALLRERQSTRERNVIFPDTEYLQNVIDSVIRCKIEKLLKKDDVLNPCDDIANLNVPTPNKDLQNVHKSMPIVTLDPSKNIFNIDEENMNKTVDLGLATELIIQDEIKVEAENDNINMKDNDDDINEVNLTLNTETLNNATDNTCDIESYLPGTKIIRPGVNDTTTDISDLSNCVTADNTEPVSDDYVRNFFNELGEVMSVELSINKQILLQSQINELVRKTFLNEDCTVEPC